MTERKLVSKRKRKKEGGERMREKEIKEEASVQVCATLIYL